MGLTDFLQSTWQSLLNWGKPTVESVRAKGRINLWDVNQALYDNTIYQVEAYRRHVLSTFCGARDGRGRIVGHFNPAHEITEAFQNVLPGTWNKEVKPVAPDDGSDGTPEPISPELAHALTRVWRDSNLDTEKARVIRLAALMGTVGLRVSQIAGNVVVQVDEARRLHNVEEDASGNVVAVCLKYKQPKNFGTVQEPDLQQVEVIEVITKDDFSKKVEGAEQLKDAQRVNSLGFCPYVLLRHKDNGTTFGDWAFRGLEAQIHDINFRITQQGRSINRGQYPKWFFTGGGPKPSAIDIDGESSALYVQNAPGTPPPSAQAIVPQIDHGSAMAYDQALRDMMRGSAPVLTINDVKLFSGLSGETIAQVLKPAESAILSVRPNYHHGFIRVMQMGVSMGIDAGLWSVGGGSGDDAYKAGRLAFSFSPQPALPPTTFDQVRLAQVGQAGIQAKLTTARQAGGIVSNPEQLRLAGYPDESVKKIMAEKAVDVPTGSEL